MTYKEILFNSELLVTLSPSTVLLGWVVQAVDQDSHALWQLSSVHDPEAACRRAVDWLTAVPDRTSMFVSRKDISSVKKEGDHTLALVKGKWITLMGENNAWAWWDKLIGIDYGKEESVSVTQMGGMVQTVDGETMSLPPHQAEAMLALFDAQFPEVAAYPHNNHSGSSLGKLVAGDLHYSQFSPDIEKKLLASLVESMDHELLYGSGEPPVGFLQGAFLQGVKKAASKKAKKKGKSK